MVGANSKSIDHLQRSKESQSNTICGEFNLNFKTVTIETNNKSQIGIHLISSPSPCGSNSMKVHVIFKGSELFRSVLRPFLFCLSISLLIHFHSWSHTSIWLICKWTAKWTFFATPIQFNKGHYPVLHESILLPPAATYLPSAATVMNYSNHLGLVLKCQMNESNK